MVGISSNSRILSFLPTARSGAIRWPSFYLTIAGVITITMVAGLAFDVPKYILHPKVARPLPLLLFHSVVFIGWIALYFIQNVLIYFRKTGWHRALGLVGVVLAIIMPPLGIVTAIAMRRFDISVFHSTNLPRDLAFLAAPLSDIIAFTPCAWLAIAMRARPDYHRRLMLLSTAAIAEAGFSRLPIPGIDTYFFVGNLMLYAAAILHDRLTLGHIHRVYRWGVPLIIFNEGAAMYLWLAHPRWWVAVCGWLINIG